MHLYHCDTCVHTDSVKQVKLHPFPPILVLDSSILLAVSAISIAFVCIMRAVWVVQGRGRCGRNTRNANMRMGAIFGAAVRKQSESLLYQPEQVWHFLRQVVCGGCSVSHSAQTCSFL